MGTDRNDDDGMLQRRTSLNRSRSSRWLLGLLPLASAGCPNYRDAGVPNPITRERLPELNQEYLLYVPSHYSTDFKWPLIILCHGTTPWDNPLRQMLDWVKLAEERGFIVAAPSLYGTSAFPLPGPTTQIARQWEDEARILETVRHLRGAYNISADRVFITGWSAGNFAVLFSGLRNPTVFRAIALQQGNFDALFLADVIEHIDPHQPVAVIYGSGDLLTGGHARKCIEWLEDHYVNVRAIEVPGGHRGHPSEAVALFERVLRKEPWLHIRTLAMEDRDPLTVQFKIKSSFEPEQYEWSFGDGGRSLIAEPVHTYAEPGTYRITLIAQRGSAETVRRVVDLQVPQMQAFAPRPTRWETDRPGP